MFHIFSHKYNALIELFFPRKCFSCNDNLIGSESLICTKCFYDLPRTFFENDENNQATQIFWGRAKINEVIAFFYFQKKGALQRIMHYLKYKNIKELGYELGYFAGSRLSANNYSNVDLIIPVPLHTKKMKIRSYNQSEWIGKGIAEALKIGLDNASLIRTKYSVSQTKKSKFERWDNVSQAFEVTNKENIEGKHILLVDDVLTTGATLIACASRILEVKGTKVSIFILAIASS